MLEAIKNRRSCRKFDRLKEVEKEKLDEIINAGLNAPSAKNGQAGIIIVIKNQEIRDKVSKINAEILGAKEGVDPFYNAPIILLVAVKKNVNAQYDGSVIIENMMLEAANQGLGSIWIHRAKQELENPAMQELLKSTGLDLSEYEGVGHVALGYSLMENYPNKEIIGNRVFYIE